MLDPVLLELFGYFPESRVGLPRSKDHERQIAKIRNCTKSQISTEPVGRV